MSFCPHCDDEQLRSTRSSKDKAKKVLKCMKCGYEQEILGRGSISSIQEDRIRKAHTIINDGTAKGNPNMVVKAICPKCQHDEAATWQVQTRGGDEPSTHFFRCTKCNHTWREY